MKSNYKSFHYSKLKIAFPLSAVICLLLVVSCEYQNKEDLFPSDPCMPESVSFNNDLLPIIDTNCNTSGCHNSDDRAAGIDLSNYEGVFQSIEVSMRFSGAINHESGFSPMPKGGVKLPACDISLIEIWIANGSNDN